ncbi:MAG: hypothetical protein LBC40_01750 [Dysgonamonadaceae bacterium]|jgi:hypothetical protein|nr:hypothetical protein [Dysgonamonadaceae bacterium]
MRTNIDVYAGQEDIPAAIRTMQRALKLVTDFFPDREKALAAAREACTVLQLLRKKNSECEKAYNEAMGFIRTWET